MATSKLDRLRWRIAVAVAPTVSSPPAETTSADSFRALLEGLGHRVSKARGGDPEMSALVLPLYRASTTPFDAKLSVTSTHARAVVREVVKIADPEARVTLIAGRRSSTAFMFDSAVLNKLSPFRSGEPELVVPSDRISPRSGRDSCHYCHDAPGLTVDHVVAASLGGSNYWWNTVSACNPCNVKKGNFAPKCSCDFCARSVALFLDGYRRA